MGTSYVTSIALPSVCAIALLAFPSSRTAAPLPRCARAAATSSLVFKPLVAPSCQSTSTSSAARRACQYFSATTATPHGMASTSITPGLLRAASSRIAFGRAPNCGPWIGYAHTMSGTFTSMP